MNNVSRYQPYVLGVLRIVLGYTFMLHGMAKLFGVPHVAMFDGLQLFSLMGLAGVRIGRWRVIDFGLVYASCRLYSVRSNGGGILYDARALIILVATAQPRGSRCAV